MMCFGEQDPRLLTWHGHWKDRKSALQDYQETRLYVRPWRKPGLLPMEMPNAAGASGSMDWACCVKSL